MHTLGLVAAFSLLASTISAQPTENRGRYPFLFSNVTLANITYQVLHSAASAMTVPLTGAFASHLLSFAIEHDNDSSSCGLLNDYRRLQYLEGNETAMYDYLTRHNMTKDRLHQHGQTAEGVEGSKNKSLVSACQIGLNVPAMGLQCGLRAFEQVLLSNGTAFALYAKEHNLTESQANDTKTHWISSQQNKTLTQDCQKVGQEMALVTACYDLLGYISYQKLSSNRTLLAEATKLFKDDPKTRSNITAAILQEDLQRVVPDATVGNSLENNATVTDYCPTYKLTEVTSEEVLSYVNSTRLVSRE